MQIEKVGLGSTKKAKKINTQEDEAVCQEAGTIPKICVVLEDHQVGYKSTMVEVEGEIAEQTVSVLINPGSTHSYITPRVFGICAFKKLKNTKSWIVQLATGTKRKVNEVVEKCPLVMNGLVTCVI